MKNGTICFRTMIPDYSSLTIPEYGWEQSVYGNVKEIIPEDAPQPLGNEVVTTTYVDANLMHDVTTGRSVTAVLHFLNQTPVEWYSKKQSTVETAACGAEFAAGKAAAQQITALRLTL